MSASFISDISDLDFVSRLSSGKVDLTYGSCVIRRFSLILFANSDSICSALDVFGGTKVKFLDLVQVSKMNERR